MLPALALILPCGLDGLPVAGVAPGVRKHEAIEGLRDVLTAQGAGVLVVELRAEGMLTGKA